MSEAPSTPIAVKTMVIVQLLLLAIAGGFLRDAPASTAWPAAMVLVAQAFALWGIWSLRRWGVIAYTAFLILNVILLARTSTTTMPALLSAALLVVVRGAALVPVVWYRSRFR